MELLKIYNAEELEEISAEAIRYKANILGEEEQIYIALPGGRSVRPILKGLHRLPYQVLKRLFIILADERYDEMRNRDELLENGLQHLMDQKLFSPEQLITPDLELPIEESARRYGEGLPNIDIFFIGAGEDGHAASLFPNHPVLSVQEAAAHIDDSPKPPRRRITMTPLFFKHHMHTADCYLLFLGESKYEALNAFITHDDPKTYPVTLFKGFESLKVITDQEVSI